MDQNKALAVLKTLAAGVDPHSGESFPADSPYQHPDVVRALYAVMEALSIKERRSPAPRTPPSNAGKPWSKEEDASLLAAFAAGETSDALAAKHGRSRMGIEARLAKYGKMQPPAALPSTRLKAGEPAALHPFKGA